MRKLLLVFFALTAFVMTVGTNAAVTSRNLGYVSDSEDIYAYDGFSNASTEPANWSIAVRLPKDEIGKYVGGSLTQVLAGWSCYTQASSEVTAWVRTSYDSENLTSGKGILKFGWNTVKFDAPYVIPDDVEEIWFGYDVVAPPGEYCIATSVYGNKQLGACYLVNRDIYATDPEGAMLDVCEQQSYGLILTLLTVEIDDATMQNRVAPTSVKYNPMGVIGNPGTALLSVKNEGANEVSSLTLSYRSGDLIYEKELEMSTPLAANKTASLAVPLPALATGIMELTVSEVNGAGNGVDNSLELSMVAIPEDVASNYVRRSLLEYFVSESEYRVPIYFNDYLMPAYELHKDNVTLVCRHMNDQFMIGDDEDSELAAMLANDDKQQVYCPAMALDRSVQINNRASSEGSLTYNTLIPDYQNNLAHVNGVYGEAYNTPTFAGMTAEASYDIEKGLATLYVEGDIAEGVLPEGEKLQLSVYLVEDNVFSNSQEFVDDGEGGGPRDFYHQAVIRQQPTPVFGEVITEIDGQFDRSYEVEVDPEWKAADMKVIAVLSRSEKNPLLQRNVVNVCESEFDPTGAFITNVKGNEGTVFEVVDGAVTVRGKQNQDVEVFNMAGLKVPNMSLSGGVYVVRCETEVAKIVVK